ncbi:glutathione S-transferase family protein [Alphaproteobacteria bacterium KMM 3653]|uniref:Glutathione S-transferase family protein n=1 Tax=Harenicola maris TaxID=2841044 RepID=A0AAP2CP05_9RHOB|nr:glutathione S-transferase family protein [Harenicola maris]
MLKLYNFGTSVCSVKVRIGMAEIGLDYEDIQINLQKGEQFAPEFMALNPSAAVPVLIDDGMIIVESSLILEYLDRIYNASNLMPKDRAAEVEARHWLLRCIAIHAAANTLTFSTVNRSRSLASKTPEEIEAGIAKMPDPVNQIKRRDLYAQGLKSPYVAQALMHLRRAFADMDAALSKGDWITGPDFGISDIALVSYVDRFERLGFEGLWQDSTPRVGEWLAAMQARQSYTDEVLGKIDPKGAASMRETGSEFWPELEGIWNAIT